MKSTGAKRNVCPGSCVSTGVKFPVAPVESAPMFKYPKVRALMDAPVQKHRLIARKIIFIVPPVPPGPKSGGGDNV